MAEPLWIESERRRTDRRTHLTLAELTVPEVRRMLITTILFVVVLVLFLAMIRSVIIATVTGVIVAAFIRPIYCWLLARIPRRSVAALLTMLLFAVPGAALAVYSYREIAEVGTYVHDHQEAIAREIDLSLRQLPLLGNANIIAAVKRGVELAATYGAAILGSARSALARLALAATIFTFTVYYVLTDAEGILAYIEARIPPRYLPLTTALESNVRSVLNGAIYSSLVTQAIKSGIILVLCVLFGVPLALVLAILSFVIGFFPIVGSWSVYVPVAGWLLVFGNAPAQAMAMLFVGFFVNTLYISTVLRPKMAAERSHVLNFYWMLVALVTGVFTFGLVGILIGPMLIGLLKAMLDATAGSGERLTAQGTNGAGH